MRDLRNYLINPFDNSAISFNEMAALTTDHLGKLGNQNGGGAWTGRIAATSTAMAAFDDAITDNITQGNARRARKYAKNNFREALQANVRMIVKWVEAAFGEGSEEVLAVTGTGGEALRRAPDDEVENYLQSVIDGLTPLIGNGVDAQRLTDAEALKSQWNAIYAASEQSTANKQMTEMERRAAKLALAGTLFDTLLEVAAMYPGQPEVIPGFFTMSLAGGPSLSGPGSTPGGGGGSESSSVEESTSVEVSTSMDSSSEESSWEPSSSESSEESSGSSTSSEESSWSWSSSTSSSSTSSEDVP